MLERAYEFLYPSQGHPSESINSLGNIYPGLYGTVVGHALSLLTEATEALTVLTED